MKVNGLPFGFAKREYEVDRSWQDAFVNNLYDMGFDSYGIPDKDEFIYKGEFKTIESELGSARYFENDTFIIMPYYWGEDEKIASLPNFIHKPTGFELEWYKYPLRAAYMSDNLTFEELMEIMEDCKRSLGIKKSIPKEYVLARKNIEIALYHLRFNDDREKTHLIRERLKEIINELNDG